MQLPEHLPVIGPFPVGPVLSRPGMAFPPANWIGICTLQFRSGAKGLQSPCHVPDLPEPLAYLCLPLKKGEQSASTFACRGDDMYLSRLTPILGKDEDVVWILLMRDWPGF